MKIGDKGTLVVPASDANPRKRNENAFFWESDEIACPMLERKNLRLKGNAGFKSVD